MILDKHYRTLPGTDLSVAPFCLGTANWGGDFRGLPLEQLFENYIKAGGNFFDTAHCYAFWLDALGESERSLGELIRKRSDRSKVVIATKGAHPPAPPKYPKRADWLSAKSIGLDIDDSLSRLGFDFVDLYYLHRDDGKTPVSEIIESLNAEVKRGRIRYFGASNWTIARIIEANAFAVARGLQGFSASQPQWSLAHPNAPVPTADPANRYLMPDDLAWHRQSGLPVIPYSPTAQGYFGSDGQRAAGTYNNPTSVARLDRTKSLAAKLGATPNQIALAYLCCQPFTVIPILGTNDLNHLADALTAASIKLTFDQIKWLEDGTGY